MMEVPVEPQFNLLASEGSLSQVALAEVLKTVALNELSGTLEVSSGRVAKSVYFDRGFVVFAGSNADTDRLGHLLVRRGRITEDDLAAALSLVGERRRIGEALVGKGFLSEDELGEALAYQARAIVSSLFAAEGTYRFEEQECPIALDLRLSLSIYRIQLEGVRLMTNGELIGKSLPSLDTELVLSSCPPFSFEDVRFLPEELLVMEAAQKKRPVEGILQRVPKKRSTVLRTVYGLLSAGVLETVADRTVTPLKVQEETGTFLLSQIDSEADAVQTVDERQQLLLAFENTEHASACELLGVAPDASEEEIRRAYVIRQEEWESEQRKFQSEETLFLKVEEIRARLDRAKAKLLEERAPVAGTPKSTVAAFRSVEDRDEVKRLLKEVKLRKIVNDREGVISFLYEIVKLAPQNAKFEAMLAQALASHPVMRAKAERHFRKALSLDPQNAELHYLLGRYYLSFDMKNRALAEFKTALRIDPRLSQARSALVDLKASDDTSLQRKLKQLFA
ncbi:MAG TPA: DUF4388 domain-containing protein [Vicinamibacteria bacterium]|nr:DUF4388 domain-containing protein [Vicinamibacteria bacterium]